MNDKQYLIDSSLWIFALRKNPHKEIKDFIDRLLEMNSVYIIGLIKVELLGGVKSEKEFLTLKDHLDALQYIEVDAALWDGASRLAFELRKKGITVPFTDILIAAVAGQKKLVLVHADHHFDLIARYTKSKVISYVNKI